MKSRNELMVIIKNALVETLNTSVDKINEETRLVNDLAAESIDFLDIVSEVEKEVDFEMDIKTLISQSKHKNDVTVGEMVSYLEKTLEQK